MEVFRKHPPKEKRPAGKPPQWTTEYMFMVAQKVVEEGMTYREAAKTFNVSTGSVGSFVRKYKKGNLSAVSKGLSPVCAIFLTNLQPKWLGPKL